MRKSYFLLPIHFISIKKVLKSCEYEVKRNQSSSAAVTSLQCLSSFSASHHMMSSDNEAKTCPKNFSPRHQCSSFGNGGAFQAREISFCYTYLHVDLVSRETDATSEHFSSPKTNCVTRNMRPCWYL